MNAPPQTLSARVAELARRRPAGDAYRWGAAAMTWAEYDSLADAIAARLSAHADEGDRVLVQLPDGGGVHAAFLACERAGLIAVGVGWRAGPREVANVAERTGARVAVVPPGHPLPDGVETVVRLRDLDDHPTPDDGPSGSLSGATVGPDDLWLINSTSGTTGMPKCVQQTQARWQYFHRKAVEFGHLGPTFGHDEVWMSVVPAPFGFGLWTAHVSPTVLGVPCIVQSRFDAAAAADAIERHGVTVLCAVSSQFVMILDAAGAADLSSLRVMFTGGEAISVTRAREFERRTGCTILNFYGSNETGMLSGTRIGDPVEQRLTTGGRVVPEMHVRLYDADGARLPGDRGQGIPAAQGPALSPGYWDDQDANRALFTDDGWMRMGDVVHIDDDGWLTVVGRTADFIIRGGKNISAPAVEAEVATHPAVALCAAAPVPDERLGERVAIYVELRNGHSLDLDDLRAHLADRGVSKEWWPEHLVIVDALPRSSGGKIDKGALRSH